MLVLSGEYQIIRLAAGKTFYNEKHTNDPFHVEIGPKTPIYF